MKAKSGKKTQTILVVEDEGALRELYCEWLKRSGYQVIEAADGLTGIERIQHDQPSLVLLDIMLPKKDGFEILAEVRRNPATRAIPIIVLPSLDQSFEKKQGGKLGANAYIVKPELSPARLKEAVAECLK